MVEGARLLSEYTVKSCIVGSNPILSATAHIVRFYDSCSSPLQIQQPKPQPFVLSQVEGRTQSVLIPDIVHSSALHILSFPPINRKFYCETASQKV